MINPELLTRAQQYAELSKIALDWERPLGDGTDGAVWKSHRGTAVKVLERERGYHNERDAYLRLQEYGLTEQIDGLWVPKLISYRDELWTIEMDLITKSPYILDFAKSASTVLRIFPKKPWPTTTNRTKNYFSTTGRRSKS